MDKEEIQPKGINGAGRWEGGTTGGDGWGERSLERGRGWVLQNKMLRIRSKMLVGGFSLRKVHLSVAVSVRIREQ